MQEPLNETPAATKVETSTDFIWGETNGKKYKRGSRLPKAENPAPAAKTPDVPWTWEEDGMTVIRGTARSAPGCHNVCGILSYERTASWSRSKAIPRIPTTRDVCAAAACAFPITCTAPSASCTR